jgi:hypothetical protein
MNQFELRIQENLRLNERDTRRMDRVITDVSEVSGMEKTEILDFLIFGADKELEDLKENYNWEKFRIKLQSKFIKR